MSSNVACLFAAHWINTLNNFQIFLQECIFSLMGFIMHQNVCRQTMASEFASKCFIVGICKTRAANFFASVGPAVQGLCVNMKYTISPVNEIHCKDKHLGLIIQIPIHGMAVLILTKTMFCPTDIDKTDDSTWALIQYKDDILPV